ncbi:MAG TPA: helix-turn-helix transcriptional regulator, partial [Gaiellaceae bacterium]
MHGTATPLAPPRSGARLGERVRTLRVSAGLTQTQLAGERFSKEYISQIERGKTRPTESTVAWLAERLGVDPALLSSGVSADERAKLEAALLRAEALSSAHRYDDAVEAYRVIRTGVEGTSRSLEVRVLSGQAWALQEVGQVKEAIALLVRAREIVEHGGFSDLDLADVLYRLAVCRYKLSSVSTAIALFDESLALAERSGLPCDLLRSDILQRRS